MRARAFSLGVSALLLFQTLFQAPAVAAADPSASVAPSAVTDPTVVPSPNPDILPSPTSMAAPATIAAPSIHPSPTPTPTPTRVEQVTGLAAGATEIVAKRTESSQTYDNHDGTFTSVFASGPEFYQAAGSTSWQPIAVGFAPGTKADALVGTVPVAMSDQAPAAVSLFKLTSKDFLTVTRGSQSVGFSLPMALAKAAKPTTPVVDGVAADYVGILPGIDLRVIARPLGSKSFLILHTVPTDPTYTFRVEAPGLTLKPQDDGSISLVDASGTTVATIPHPYALDSTDDSLSGGGRYTDKASLTLGQDADGAPTITISVDPGWLASAVYPVYVDPSVDFNSTSNTADAHTSSLFPTTNFGKYQLPTSPNYYEMWLGLDPSGTSGTSHDYVRWDVSSIGGVTVESAAVSTHPWHQYANAPTVIRSWIARLTSSFNESTIDYQNAPSGGNDLTWIDGVEGQTSWSNASSGFNALVQDWIDGTNPTSGANDGIRIWEDGNNATFWKRIIASEDSTDPSHAWRPTLRVTYHVPAVAISPTGGGLTRATTLTWSTDWSAQAAFDADLATNVTFTTGIQASGLVPSQTATSWAIPGALTPGTTYYWHVRTKNTSAVWSAFSATASFVWDGSPPITTFTTPAVGSTITQTSPTYTVGWTEDGTGSAISTRSLQRWSGPIVTAGTCAGVSWAKDGLPVTTVSSVTATGLVAGCYQWQETLTDAAGNDSTTSSGSVLVAAAAPSVTAFTAPSTPTNATTLPYSLTFSESVTGLAAGDFAISGSATGWTVSTITGAGPYTITLTGGTAGTVILTLNANTVDGTGGTPGPTSASTASTVTVDRTAPNVSAFTPPATPTGAVSLPYSLTFSESVTGLAAGDFAISGSATGWTVGAPSGSGAGPYTITLSGGDAGTVILTLNANTVTDTAANTGPASANVAATVTVDRTAPSVSAFTPPSTPTNATSLPYNLTFSQGVTGLAAGDFAITGTATGWTVTTVTGSGVGPYTVTLGGGTPGTVILTLNAGSVTNSLLNPGPTSPSAAPTVTVDRTAPAAPSVPDLAAGSDSGPSSIDNITNVTTGLAFTGTAEANATVVLLDGLTQVGTAPADSSGAWTIASAGPLVASSHSFTATATDAAGNPGPASGALSVLIVTSVGPADFTAPDEAAALGVTTSPYAVSWVVPSDPAGIASQTLQSRDAASVAGACATVTWTGWSAAVDAMSPNAADLTTGLCHQWQLTLTDGAGNARSESSGTVLYVPTVQVGVAHVTAQLDPQLKIDLLPQPSALHPGSQLTVTGQLTYPGAVVDLLSEVTASNPTSAAATIEAVTITLERRVAGQGSWVAISSYHAARPSWSQITVPPAGLPRIGVSALGIIAGGVTYPESFDAFVGTGMDPGVTATWTTHLAVPLDAALIHMLQDAGQTSGIREVLHVEVSYASGAFAQPNDTAYEATTAIQALDSAVTDATIALAIGGASSSTFSTATTPALAHLDLGATTITVATNQTLPGPAAKGLGETDAEYTARLRSYGSFTVAAHVAAVGSTNGPVVADDAETLVIEMPILVVSVPPVATSTTGGSSTSVSLSVLNVGNVTANATSVETSLGGTISGTASGLSSTLGSTVTANLFVTYEVPTSHPEGTTTSTVEVSWADADGNLYGPITSTSDVWVTTGQAGYPSVSLTASAQSMFASEPIIAIAADDVAVTSVELRIDGVTSDSTSSAPYDFQWDTTAVPDGDHVLQVRAHDADGHASTTAPLTVHVDNSLSSDARAQADLASGMLAADGGATIRVDAIIDPASLPTRYQSDTPSTGDGTGDLIGAIADWNTLDPGTQQAIVTKLASLDEGWSSTGTSSDVLASVGQDIAAHCNLAAPCIFETDHFRIEYTIDSNLVQSPPLDDTWEFSPGPDLSACGGTCDGVPDWIDRLAYGFEQAWRSYDDMGYPMPALKTRVAVSNFLMIPTPWGPEVSIHDTGGRGLTVPWVTLVPYADYNRYEPIYLARHEFFHTMQIDTVLGPDITNQTRIENAVALFTRLASDRTQDPRWFLEATAEWGAHKAAEKAPAPGHIDREDDDWPTPEPGQRDHERYAHNLSLALVVPELPLIYSNESREYGEFIFAEFLEEWAGGSASFSGSDFVDPAPSVIMGIWTRIGAGQSSLAAIKSALEGLEPSSSFAAALPAFTRANYLLNAPGVPGTYRDPAASDWRDQLRAEWSQVATRGDDPALPEFFSASPRPGRHHVLVADSFFSFQPTVLEPGGSSYIEFSGLNSSGRYGIKFTVPVGSPIVASIAAFSTYPTPCAAPTTADVAGDQTVVVYLPDDCQRLTIMLTHVDPMAGSVVPVQVGIWPEAQLVQDTFTRDVSEGWGVATLGGRWKPTQPEGILGDVVFGQGRLAVGPLTGSRMDDFSSPISDLLAVGQFSDCGPTDDLILVDAGSPVVLTKGGVLVGSQTSYIQLANFDACQPWFIRIQQTDGVLAAKVWQATEPEPMAPQVVTAPSTGPSHLDIDTIGFPSTPTRHLIIDWIYLENQPYG